MTIPLINGINSAIVAYIIVHVH